MDVKQSPEVGWDFLLAISIVGILAASWFAFGQNKSTPRSPLTVPITAKDIQTDTQRKEAQAVDAEQSIRDKTWDVDVEVFGSRALDDLTKMSIKHHVQLSGFRIRKSITAANLIEAPLAVVAEGSFADVMALVGSLEEPESKLAVSQLNITASGGTDKVTATVALTGFLYKEDK